MCPSCGEAYEAWRDQLMGDVAAWQSRPLEPMYPVMIFDALRVKIRDDAIVRTKAVHLALDFWACYPMARVMCWASGSSKPKV